MRVCVHPILCSQFQRSSEATCQTDCLVCSTPTPATTSWQGMAQSIQPTPPRERSSHSVNHVSQALLRLIEEQMQQRLSLNSILAGGLFKP